ncbi:bifunctional tRNA (5-methylaminomethyl-2-thiouridine)(34)-methyltransferase MnmD/FAD-dependent 5-carboxymethylaminomethyl-2-thiouridine(34) oxidoreductase MnmC [Parahaliea sp. F7430]|uniref:tRNA 5-methylaminomethyl-2-thiouridine biosynthesis bifunctional protein MnmC n=1 Tax=Sediminihaliea albiluteola TaxID=2758564 RepID=A0A7W2TU57_9GAMM|nr:bifunctional tRNA (5-methylaminomethyl-2-thiouridine)(34)-methyltransferase MnmD/FAD-dependent 5-carboxymethylaminomethyl-2-thiouridine(34) oxidoreductase MnmC [Sediminihaliea albiluteola]MBA6411925.1 bifunctional tRNA (5-methylaminomethyl-2-thiouridine)(34)-methyltransferase MnmD/FAD-dependent 5-carboxymethylaminomethyl-2-thiouridine(34) oxidoreductase MnmC [Sediminihaliea albiluteola]
MPKMQQAWQAMPRAELDWDAQGIPNSRQFEDIYYDRSNGLAESHYVFLQGNQLPDRWQHQRDDSFVIGETGFGSGLNFLMTWQAWLEQAEAPPRLHFLSMECFPLRRDELARALANWPQLARLSEQLIAQYPEPIPGVHRMTFEGGNVILDLWWAEANEALTDMLARQQPLVDAWYLDGFAPSRNSALWQESLLKQLGQLSKPGATLATFTAASAVRRGLQAAGFEMHKGPGFGRKRERLLGQLAQPAEPAPLLGTPWDIPASSGAIPSSAIVLGAGLAGTATAAALAKRGIHVTVLESAEVAGAASGNQQGILYTRLSRQHSPLADFSVLSFSHAAALYRALLASGELIAGRDGQLCGSFHLHRDNSELALLKELLTELPDLAEVLSADAASARLGVELASPGFWYPHSGWLSPPAICRHWLSQSKITLLEHCGQVTVSKHAGQWQARNHSGELLAEADCAVIACGHHSAAQSGLEWLPLQAIRGQTSSLPAGQPFEQLRAALCHDGYIAPARDGQHCIGATFNLNDSSQDLSIKDHQHNLQQLSQALPQWSAALEALNPATLEGRVGFRCASPDYLPLVGPVPKLDDFVAQFAALRRNAKRDIPACGIFEQGLYLNTGHGSRGLSSTPLAAELLASQICHEPLPMTRELARALAPARFLIRDLGRKRL